MADPEAATAGGALEFGVWEHFERITGVPDRQLYEQRIELVQRAEQLGFYGYHISEHHNGPLCMAPSPLLFLSAVAQRTSTIRLGTLILILPLYDPLRLIEEICMLDHLSGGRLMPGVGRGFRDLEQQWFGRDPSESVGRFNEFVEILLQGLREGRLSFRGEYYRFDDLELAFQPLQKPHPPLWWPGNLEAAAARGASVIGGAAHGMTREAINRYWESFGKIHSGSSRGPVAQPKVGSTRHVVVADTDQEARTIARRAWEVHADNVWRVPSQRLAARGTPGMNVGEEPDLVMARRRALVVGSPDTVRDALAEFLDEAGPGHNYLVADFQWGDISHDEAMRSLELYGTQVAPALAARGVHAVDDTCRASLREPVSPNTLLSPMTLNPVL